MCPTYSFCSASRACSSCVRRVAMPFSDDTSLDSRSNPIDGGYTHSD